tara:strand:+ start:379 stop:615 length:237 start_codon:yes stop_codon:yes gene_type:complete
MNILLTIVMCSSVANTCLEPFTFEEIYYDSYSCMVDGYKKSMEKTIEIGSESINQHGIYLKFDCSQMITPLEKPKINA